LTGHHDNPRVLLEAMRRFPTACWSRSIPPILATRPSAAPWADARGMGVVGMKAGGGPPRARGRRPDLTVTAPRTPTPCVGCPASREVRANLVNDGFSDG
jgi:hypothetical protein